MRRLGALLLTLAAWPGVAAPAGAARGGGVARPAAPGTAPGPERSGQRGAPPAGLSRLERDGRLIYQAGESPSGAGIDALVGGDPSPLPATALPCAGCHGPDGRGRPEGGVVPPDITWSELTKPYGHAHGPRRHPPFDERSLGRAITDGLDPASQPLDASMPRYSLSRGDLAALVAWLKVLERQREVGLGADTLALATLLPGGPGRLGEVGEAMKGTLEAALAEVNAGGGLNGRRLELQVVRYDPAEGPGVKALERALEARPAFALVSGFAPGEDAALVALAERLHLPLVGPYGPFSAGAAQRWTFQTLPGLSELGRALLLWMADRRGPGLTDPAALVLRPPGAPFEAAAAAALEQSRRLGWTRLQVRELPEAGLDEAAVQALASEELEVVLVLGDDAALASALQALDGAGHHPWVLAPGTLAARAAAEAPPAFAGRLLLAYPSLPSDETAAGRGRLARLSPAGGGERHRAARTSALLAVTVLLEGLGRAGAAPTRAGLVEQLEGLSALQTGLSPPLGFTGGRRVGAWGGHVVAVDLAGRTFRPVAGWTGFE